MVTIDDVFYHIAQQMRDYTGIDRTAAVEEFFTACSFQFHICITTDVEESEFYHLEKYGRGHTFYFRLSYYEHGRMLTEQMYKLLTGAIPEMEECTEEDFNPDDRLYLFVHLMNVSPAAVKHSIVEVEM